jgi:energy-converting hydrogenase B subunit D
MNPIVECVLYLFLISTAVAALQVKGLLAAVGALTTFSFTAALLFVAMGAVDVAFTEAVVGAGVVGVFLVTAILQTTRKSID